MPTTPIRLEDDLKARVAAAAERAGQSPHAFIVGAIAQTVAQAEADAAFHASADARWARIVETGDTVALSEASAWLDARLRGEHPRRPKARKPRR
jgi:predicted transcriptional regulator